MIFCFVRETKQLTLEELDRKSHLARSFGFVLTSLAEVFSVPTKNYISYESTVWLPYFIKRYIFRQKIMKPPPIIEKEDHAEQSFQAP